MSDYEPDKVPEGKMVEMLGATKRALEGKRARGVIPIGFGTILMGEFCIV